LIPVEQVIPGPPPVARFPATFHVLGNDGVDLIDTIINGGRVVSDALVNLNLQGGHGEDDITMSLHDLELEGAVHATVAGGPGADVASVLCQNNLITGDLTVVAKGGAGIDDLWFQALDATVPEEAQLHVSLQGGGEADTLGVGLGPNLEIGGAALFDVAGDTGDDALTLLAAQVEFYGETVYQAAGGPGADRHLTVVRDSVIEAASSLTLHTTGGGGADVSQTTILSSEVLGALAVYAEGGADDDTLNVSFQAVTIVRTPEHQGRITAALFGGEGNDELGMTTVGLSKPNELDALIDGGLGRDRASVSRDLLATALFRSIEEIFLVE
jgi:hypothetical protein